LNHSHRQLHQLTFRFDRPTIALEMEFRSGKQCRERYINQLDPLIKKTVWTVEEDAIIKRVHFEIGKKWCRYMEQLPGRSDNAIKNRYHIISKDNYAEHNLHYAASLDTDAAAPPTAAAASGEFVPETAAVRLDRFRCARELLDRKIKALEREKELLVSQAAKDETEENSEMFYNLGLEREAVSLGSTSGATTADLDTHTLGLHEPGSGVSSITTTLSPLSGVGGQEELSAHGDVYASHQWGMHSYSTELDEFHFDCEDMCYNDPHGSYDEVLGFT